MVGIFIIAGCSLCMRFFPFYPYNSRTVCINKKPPAKPGVLLQETISRYANAFFLVQVNTWICWIKDTQRIVFPNPGMQQP